MYRDEIESTSVETFSTSGPAVDALDSDGWHQRPIDDADDLHMDDLERCERASLGYIGPVADEPRPAA